MISSHRIMYPLGICLSLVSLSVFATTQVKLPTVDCVINPSKEVNISAAVPGVIESINVVQGDTVTQGQLLVELNSMVEEASLSLAKARTEMTANLSTEKINYKYDRLQVKRMTLLADKKFTSRQNKDEAQRLEQLSYWRVEQAKEALKVRQLELLKAQAQLNEKKIYSHLNGVVTQRLKNEGEYVDGHPVLTLAQLNPLHVTAVFPIEHINRLNKSSKAKVFTEIDQSTGYQVRVDQIDPLGDAASGTFSVRFTLENDKNQVSAGLKCFLQIQEPT
ncbi:efflux RND transporter periplasmic adaptor subunit [Gammaproteobacteria bacterium AS21]